MKKYNIFALRVMLLLAALTIATRGFAQGSRSIESFDSIEIPYAHEDHDEKGCYWEFDLVWSCDDATTAPGAESLPSGIKISITGANILSSPTPTITGAGQAWGGAFSINSSNPQEAAWFAVAAPGPTHCSNLATGLIPSGTTHFKIYVAPTVGYQSLKGFVLGYWSGTLPGFFPDPHNLILKYSAIFQGEQPPPPVQPYADLPIICTKGATIVHIPLPHPANATVEWFKYQGLNCKDACPASAPPSAPWVPVASSPYGPVPNGWDWPTGTLTESTCYAAVITSGCFTYATEPVKILLCEPPSGSITAVSTAPSAITDIDGVHHSCGPWKGTFTLSLDKQCCDIQIVSSTLDGNVVSLKPGLILGNYTLTAKLDTPKAPDCCIKHTFSVTVRNVCGTKTLSYVIVTDRTPAPGEIKMQGIEWTNATLGVPPNVPSYLGPLCFGSAAKVSATLPKCDGCEPMKIVKWQCAEWTAPGAQPSTGVDLTDAGSANQIFTNKLKPGGPCLQSAWYRVLVQNGACEGWSDWYEIRVKPELTVTISPGSGNLCDANSHITLKAQTSYTGCKPGLPVAYQWYRDGSPISGATAATLTVSQGGNYSVVVTDAACHSKAESEAVRICGAPVLKLGGPCVACEGEKFELTAIVLASPKGCYTDCSIEWSTSDGAFISSHSGPSVWANKPGTYIALLKCGGCYVKEKIVVGPCPGATACDCKGWMDGDAISAQFAGFQPLLWKCRQSYELNTSGQCTITVPHYLCSDPGCTAQYDWVVTGTTSGSGHLNGTNTFTFNFVPGGSYSLSVTALCGTKKCATCILKVLAGPSPCNCGSWPVESAVRLMNGSWQNAVLFQHSITIAQGTYTIDLPEYRCNDTTACKPTYSWSAIGPATANLSSIIAATSHETTYTFTKVGTYTIRVMPRCGDHECTPASFTIKVIQGPK